MSVAVSEVLPCVAVIVAVCCFADADVDTLKFAVYLPAGIRTEAGTVAPLVLDSFTINPPTGALPLKVSVPTVDPPPLIVEGLRAIDDRTGGAIIRTAESETPFSVAVINEISWYPTAVVAIGNVATV